MPINKIVHWGYTYIGHLNDLSLKHRNHILIISILMMVISPEVKITFGKASVIGLGINIDPPQTIYIGLVLLVILIYRVIAFWITALITQGTNKQSAYNKAALKIDEMHILPGPATNIGDVINEEANSIKYKWELRRLTWEFIIPNLLALIALLRYGYYYICAE